MELDFWSKSGKEFFSVKDVSNATLIHSHYYKLALRDGATLYISKKITRSTSCLVIK